MSPHKTTRSTWTSTAWLLMFLCVSLLAWRLGARVEQYRPAGAGRSVTVNFFDANESNIASSDEAGRPTRSGAEACDRLFRAVVVAPPVWAARSFEQDSGPALSSLCVQPVSLFSNPPPFSLL